MGESHEMQELDYDPTAAIGVPALHRDSSRETDQGDAWQGLPRPNSAVAALMRHGIPTLSLAAAHPVWHQSNFSGPVTLSRVPRTVAVVSVYIRHR